MSAASTRRVLDTARGGRAMVGVIAIMLFLTVLAAALGLSTRNAAIALDRQLAGRMTVQLVRGGDADAVVAALRATPGVIAVRPVPPEELARLLAPWLGADAADPDLPMPALIDVDLAGDDLALAARAAAAAMRAAPGARVDRHAAWMSPISDVMASVTWLAFALVALLAAATALVVMLAARAGLDAHRPTIDIMHLLGATDVQIARLFQRRISRDAMIGGVAGGAAALAIVVLLAGRIAALGSELLGGAALLTIDWVLLALLPLAFAGIAMLAARVAVTRSLRAVL